MKREFEVIDNHTVCMTALRGGAVLDAGCRGNRFGKYFRDKGHQVIGIDPAPDSDGEFRFALVSPDNTGIMDLVMTEDKEARYISSGPVTGEGRQTVEVQCLSIDELSEIFKISLWDVLKLNIEGSECEVLSSLTRPVARQIVCSFHMHTGRQTEDDILRAVRNLHQWYDTLQHKKDERFCAGMNYWDSVFILRGF